LKFYAIIVYFWLASAAFAADPRLILFVSVDQMRYDYLTRFAPLYKEGFKKLLDRGAIFTNARYRHANNETGPGHSVMLSGRHASSSGIVANDWWDPLLKKTVNVVEDPVHSPVGGPGRGASPANFNGFTVGDKIKQKWPASKVFGVSMKDRAAILPTGHRSDGAFWFETACGCFITSTYYAKEPPGWLTDFNNRKLPASYAGKSWNRLLSDTSLYEKYAGKDDGRGEWDLQDTTFPHVFKTKPPEAAFFTSLTRTPFSDEILLQLALLVLETNKLGTHGSPDLLTVSFSAPDVIGHTYGAYSQEEMDEYLRLDGILGQLLQAVEQRVGADNYLVILTADHASMPVVEWLQDHGHPEALRRRPTVLSDPVNAALKERYPSVPNLIASFSSPDFYLDLEVIKKAGLKREEVERVIIDALMATGVVEKVYTHADMYWKPAGSDPYIELFRNSFFASRSPHLMVMPKMYTYISTNVGGTGHGSPYDYDRHVPIVWMGPGIPHGRFDTAAGPEDIAPTLAKKLDIPFPIEPDARLLTELLK